MGTNQFSHNLYILYIEVLKEKRKIDRISKCIDLNLQMLYYSIRLQPHSGYLYLWAPNG